MLRTENLTPKRPKGIETSVPRRSEADKGLVKKPTRSLKMVDLGPYSNLGLSTIRTICVIRSYPVFYHKATQYCKRLSLATLFF
ncbi:hypothetical protein OUZ56_003726 [Daphnia magna]|uniref:Uncharacterized protein n=1 Tax=Daphnia magna TaxID=35525 RepID=A0ABR0A9M0_9CRUS|nr:hypothetical protein OUZ56_003726 [Daphnia magna]